MKEGCKGRLVSGFFAMALGVASTVVVAASAPALASGESVKPVKVVPPKYPRGAERRGIEGWVKVQYNVMTDGSTAEIVVVEAEPACQHRSKSTPIAGVKIRHVRHV